METGFAALGGRSIYMDCRGMLYLALVPSAEEKGR